MTFEANCLPTGVGSLPHTDPREACDLVLRHCPEIPFWPQLPRRSPLESMYLQYQEGFPAATIKNGKITVDVTTFLETEEFSALYAEAEAEEGRLPGRERAAGLRAMVDRVRRSRRRPLAMKGQVTGPISQGLQMTDPLLRPALYDELLADAVVKQVSLMAVGQEQLLGELAPTTIISIDEPYLSVYGSALFSLSREQVTGYLEEVFGHLQGLKGIHCCGNTDWSVVLETSVDILNIDAYGYSDTLALYASAVGEFLDRGGIIAWGIVPADGRVLADQTVGGLVDRLLAAMQLLVDKGLALDRILPASLITPSCGLGSLEVAQAQQALELTAGVSAEMRRRYFD